MTTSADALSAATTAARRGEDSLPVEAPRRTSANRAYYSASIESFLAVDADAILAALVRRSEFEVLPTQRDAWLEQIELLKIALRGHGGWIYLEYSIPRMGKRVDAIVLIGPVVFVLEFKVGEKEFTSHAADQVFDYALDLKDFYEPCRSLAVIPVLVATKAKMPDEIFTEFPDRDFLSSSLRSNTATLRRLVTEVLHVTKGEDIDLAKWDSGRYCPTPTIVEAARALYAGHSVEDISRNDAKAINIGVTSHAVSDIISNSRNSQQKSICFVTGVPGAGKTLVGLDIANEHFDPASDLYSVFLSGNGPLVRILREALARDSILRDKQRGIKTTKSSAERRVKAFIQNVHNFRDECLSNNGGPPLEHVALFDEAQRAWNLQQTSKFMRQKKGIAAFERSEPEFLIECLDRHRDWAVVVCLVGGGQEINTGEAGIGEWIRALNQSFPEWHVYVSPRLTDAEYGAGQVLQDLRDRPNVTYRDELHLSVSMRSFRSENVSLLVKQLLDQDLDDAKKTWADVRSSYPIVVTRDIAKAKEWLKRQARGTQRCGIMASSGADRLKPCGINVRSEIDPVHWFLNSKDDVRSSYYLEDVATEFDVQGLELDWVCVAWDADFRYGQGDWEYFSFGGNKWRIVQQQERRMYLKNAYRVLLTRARQGMVILVPNGDLNDHTRQCKFYDSTFRYLREIGFGVI